VKIRYQAATASESTTPQTVEVEFDATLREVPTYSATVTEHPVERGAPITDHVIPQNGRVQFEVVVTNTPSQLPSTHMGGVTARQENGVLKFSGQFNRVKSVHDEMVALVGKLCSFSNAIRDYEDMVISNLTAPREARDGRSIRFTFEAQQIRFVEVKTGPAKEKRHTRIKKGSTGTTEAKEPKQLESIAHAAKEPAAERVKKVFSFFGINL
jgi:hypothetical protein